MNFDTLKHPHRRRNALTGDWILVSPHRTQRPWLGQEESVAHRRPAYDPGCYLCPRNARAGGETNPDYESTHVFTNDFAALVPGAMDGGAGAEAETLFRAEPVSGTCRVVCFSPRHDLTLAEMTREEIGVVVAEWVRQSEELGREYAWVQIFENKGAVMGCSNPHPHGQIWAGNTLPNEVAKEDRRQRRYYKETGSPLLIDYLAREIEDGSRLLAENEEWAALVPYWALWPFETLLLPRRPRARLGDLEEDDRIALADILKRLLVRYDNLFQTSFPYSMGWHGAPFTADDPKPWQLHAHFYPPLLRSATVKKFMVGYEMLAEPQRDLTPEQAAAQLRDCPEIHYKNTSHSHEISPSP